MLSCWNRCICIMIMTMINPLMTMIMKINLPWLFPGVFFPEESNTCCCCCCCLNICCTRLNIDSNFIMVLVVKSKQINGYISEHQINNQVNENETNRDGCINVVHRNCNVWLPVFHAVENVQHHLDGTSHNFQLILYVHPFLWLV